MLGNLELTAASSGGIRVKGWAAGPDGAMAQISAVYGNQNVSKRADLNRPDVAKVYPALGANRGFDFLTFAGPGSTRVCITATSGGSSLLLGCSTLTVPAGSPFGTLDEVTGVAGDGSQGPGIVVRGWAIDPNTNGPIQVHVYYATGANPLVADQPRADLGKFFPASGPNHGYSVRLSAPAGSSGELCAYAINAPGPADNPILACKPYTVPG
jgi:hypothetical protein